jgi:3-hydroxyisobutyrate dehydrogenase
MTASSAGHGGEDDSAVIKVFPGIDLPAGGRHNDKEAAQ